MYGKINVKPLKNFTRRELKSCQLIREFILEEPDYIPVEEFLFKFRIWLQLLEKDIEKAET